MLLILFYLLAVFPGAVNVTPQDEYPAASTIAILSLLVAILIFVVPLAIKCFSYYKKQVVKDINDEHWKKANEEDISDMKKRIHWLEIMMVTLVELQVCGETDRYQAMRLLEQFKLKYPNPTSFNLSVCEEYVYEFIEAVKHGRGR